MRQKKLTVAIVFALTMVSLFAWAGYRLAPESAPVARGAKYAQIGGCIGCHGNPENPLIDENQANCSNLNNKAGHPEYSAPCDDVMAYFEAVRLNRNFNNRANAELDNPLFAGEQLARQYSCFQCHGQLGQGGFRNSKSLKGYVPGYFGSDFRALTRNADPASVRSWIMHGIDPAIAEKRISGQIAEFFFNRQVVSMPSYKSLPPAEIEILVNYVIAINEIGPMTADMVRSYGKRSQTANNLTSIDSSLALIPLQATNGRQ